MRRMYSEQELTKIIGQVLDSKIEDGSFDEVISDAVDAYLVEHPVDITALEGQDVELASLDATGLITGGEIVEKMTGYSFNKQTTTEFTLEYVYAGIVKNGNKLTCVIAMNITRTSTVSDATNVGRFNIPSAVANKLFPTSIGNYSVLDMHKIQASKDGINFTDILARAYKGANEFSILLTATTLNTLDLNEKYFVRYENTFLLSDNLAS